MNVPLWINAVESRDKYNVDRYIVDLRPCRCSDEAYGTYPTTKNR